MSHKNEYDVGLQNLKTHSLFTGTQSDIKSDTFRDDVDSINNHIIADLFKPFFEKIKTLKEHTDYGVHSGTDDMKSDDFIKIVHYIQELAHLLENLGDNVTYSSYDYSTPITSAIAHARGTELWDHRTREHEPSIHLDGLDLAAIGYTLGKYVSWTNWVVPHIETIKEAPSRSGVTDISYKTANTLMDELKLLPIFAHKGVGLIYENIDFKHHIESLELYMMDLYQSNHLYKTEINDNKSNFDQKVTDELIIQDNLHQHALSGYQQTHAVQLAHHVQLSTIAQHAQTQAQQQEQQAQHSLITLQDELKELKLEFSVYKADSASEREAALQKQVDSYNEVPPEIVYVESIIKEKVPKNIRLVNERKNIIVNGNELLRRYMTGRKYKRKTGGAKKPDVIFSAINNAATHLKDKYDDKIIVVLTNQNNIPFTWRDKEYYQKISASNNIYIYLCEYIYTGKCAIKNPDVNFYIAILADKLKCRVISDKDIKITIPSDDCAFTVYMIEPDYGGVIKKVKFKYADFPNVQTPYTISFKNV